MTPLQTVRTHALLSILAAVALAFAGGLAHAAPTRTGYVTTQGLDVYYQVHGTAKGTPLVLLHGALCTIETCFGAILPELAKTRTVIVIEQQAHGRTRDVANRPLSITQMTKDTVAVLAKLGVKKADVWGYSMGSAIALELALTHPALVHKLVLTSIVYDKSGLQPGLLEGMAQLKPEMLHGTPWYASYVEVAPKNDFATLVEKVKAMDDAKDRPEAAIRALPMPVLLMVGDGDIVQPEHAVKFFRLLGGGGAADMGATTSSQLAIIPGASHVTIMAKTSLLLATIEPFLAAK